MTNIIRARSPLTTALTNQTLSGSNTTVATPLFRITGTVHITKLYGFVTTVLGSNVTAAYWRLNDQTAQQDISLATGTTLSAVVAGSFLSRRGLAATALSIRNANVGQVNEQGATGADFFSPFTISKKATASTDIEFVYTTTNTPTSGVIQHIVEWQPLSSDGNLVVI